MNAIFLVFQFYVPVIPFFTFPSISIGGFPRIYRTSTGIITEKLITFLNME